MIGLLTQLTVLIATGFAQTVKMIIARNFVPGDFAVLMLLMLIVSTLTSSICLPFVFKLGVEKGRTAYYIMIGFVCGASVLASSILRGQLMSEIQPNLILAWSSVQEVRQNRIHRHRHPYTYRTSRQGTLDTCRTSPYQNRREQTRTLF